MPIVCGTDLSKPAIAFAPGGASPNALPAGVWGWEIIPSVVRINSIDAFRLEVNVNSSVTAVTLDCDISVSPVSGGSHQILRDDGLDQDRVAGDHIWTSGLLRANTSFFNVIGPLYYYNDTNSPPGLSWWDIGLVQIQELTGETNEFLIYPQFGAMDPYIPLTTPRVLSPDVQATAHLVNIRSTAQGAQKFLREVSYGELEALTAAMYAVVPDAFDHLTFFTTDHIERLPRLTSANFNAGIHMPVRVNYDGTGLGRFDSSAYWGSAGRLLGVNVLDTAQRGGYAANATHELLHQWSSFTYYSLGLSDGTGHYSYLSGAASLVGGAQLIPTNGGFLINCHESSWGGHYAAPLDKYMMGLIDGSTVSPIPISSGVSPFNICDEVLPDSGIARMVTIAQIQQAEGLRTPTPATAQRDFTIGFVIESNGRLLNATELTFFEILARQYTQPWPASQPDPYVEFSWVPITQYFGEGTTWRSYVLSFVQPTITSALPVPGPKLAIGGLGFPRASYTLQGSTNLVDWNTVATLRADTNGAFQHTNPMTASRQFYRAVWNE